MNILASLMLAATLQSPPAGPDIAGADAVLDRFHQAAARADGEAYFSLFTPSGRFVGTDAAEQWSVEEFRAYAEPYFSRRRGWTYIPQEREVRLSPVACQCVATFDEVLSNDSYGLVRGSGTLIRGGDGWKIEHYVLSFTVPNDKARAVVAVIKAD
ncbi:MULTISPECIES: nuclear transport factor 2 family protein [unclassified Brevundimonas]|uniref:nuclear transport factor 2 family protein n=1 Tax=unclassified Brevundimonas TaxID=2622653 RepID=UPI0025C63CBA|nr:MULTISPECIES: nuclear transport factor 2 family protein [unclassified Brevundimonas]